MLQRVLQICLWALPVTFAVLVVLAALTDQ